MTLIEKLQLMGYEKNEIDTFVRAGRILVNEEVIIIPNLKIKNNDVIRVKEPEKYVSRGAYKLLKAFEVFDFKIKNYVCLDIGASTGGFTQVLLEKGAVKVFAVDVGTNQLDYKLRRNPKVISLEKTNLKVLNQKILNNEIIDFVACDVSFISIKRVFDILIDILDIDKDLVFLIKPQFEAKKENVCTGGTVPIELHDEIIQDIIQYSKDNFKFIDIVKSPILGKKSKNQEYIAWFKRIKNV